MDFLTDFLDPVELTEITQDMQYKDGQMGKVVAIYDREFPDLADVSVVLVGCNEFRGGGLGGKKLNPADEIRKAFYDLYFWHAQVKIADLGNVKRGKTTKDTYAALKTVVTELVDAGKLVVILGGSHDLTLAQYAAYADKERIIEAVSVDAAINLSIDSPQRDQNFLMEMLTGEPNYLRHYSHIGFQSYFVHPHMLETMDKLRFDCYRVGMVKEDIEEMEPVIRSANMMSFDIAAIANAFAPANQLTPNGLNGEEACTLMRHAGMGDKMSSIGIYGYRPDLDKDGLTAKQISHMIWYIIDGAYRHQREAKLTDKASFNEFNVVFAEVATTFLQSKRTGRWWMQMPDQHYIPCSFYDYKIASNNDIPERWLRAQERSI